MALTMAECYTLALGAGLPPAEAKKAAAIAMCESDGDPNAHNSTPPDDSYGLWQINMLGRLGPERRAQFNISSNSELYSPVTNAKAMKSVWEKAGRSFKPWSTYGSMEYFQRMAAPVANEAAADPRWYDKYLKPVAGALDSPVINPFSTLEAANQALGYVGKTATWVSDSRNWVRVGYVTVGLGIIVVGLVKLAGSTQTGQAVGGLAVGAATGGASLAAGAATKVASKVKTAAKPAA